MKLVGLLIAIGKNGRLKEIPGRPGCFSITPPLAVESKENHERIKKGEVVHADSVDINGKYPRTVHLKDKGLWWKIKRFKLS